METTDPKYKHKPSEKHTLEEVLKSLQDLIRNDLDEGATTTAKPETAPAAARGAVSRDENSAGRREDFAPQSPGAGPVNLSAVMRSLKDLIGNELNVGDEPVPESAKPASTHDEYLATDDKIEEYIPEELGQLDDELDISDELVLPEPVTPAPPAESLAPDTGIEPAPPTEAPPEEITPLADEIVMESLPEELAPLDEELTLGEPLEIEPAPDVSTTLELPGEISPALLAEAEPAPPPIQPEPAPTTMAPVTAGVQQELLLEESPPIELRLPPSPGIVPVPEAMTATEVTAPTVADEKPEPVEASPPTIEIEETHDVAGDRLDAPVPSAETNAAESDEFITFDTEIIATPEVAPATDETPTSTTPAIEFTSEAPAAAEPPEQKITIEIVNESPDDGARNRATVDFEILDSGPLMPEPVTTPAGTEAPAHDTGSTTLAVVSGPITPLEPVPAPSAAEVPTDVATAPEPPEPVEAAPVTPPAAEPAPPTGSPAVPAEPAASSAPEPSSLDDIPVLSEVVARPAGSSAPPRPPAPEPARPAPDRTRDLVVRAVAKLNIEMRKSGGAGLDTKTLLRLQQLIRQELEKGGGK